MIDLPVDFSVASVFCCGIVWKTTSLMVGGMIAWLFVLMFVLLFAFMFVLVAVLVVVLVVVLAVVLAVALAVAVVVAVVIVVVSSDMLDLFFVDITNYGFRFILHVIFLTIRIRKSYL